MQTHVTDASVAQPTMPCPASVAPRATDAASASDALAVHHVSRPFERDGFHASSNRHVLRKIFSVYRDRQTHHRELVTAKN
jgi:hypothetical protein